MKVSLQTMVRRRLSKLKQQARAARLALAGSPVYSAEVNLDNVLIGTQCGISLERWVERTGEWDRASRLLKDSPYVELLRSVAENEALLADDEFLESKPYYRMAHVAIEFSGNFFAATEPGAIKRQMRGFYQTFVSVRDGCPNPAVFDDYRHSADGDPLLMSKVRDSNCYELDDGHHRASVFYMLGQRRVAAHIAGEKSTYLQRLVRKVNPEGRLELYQPVPTADVRGWSVRWHWRRRLQLILEFLSREGWQQSIRTVLDADCGYGWLVDQFRQRGMNAVGVTPVEGHVKIGRVAFGLGNDALRRREAGDVPRSSAGTHDMVLFLNGLHRQALGARRKDTSQILRLLDRAAGKVLILDSGRAAEGWSRKKLPYWNDADIPSSILRHTTFTQVIPLDRDSDGRGARAGRNEEVLFACIR